MNIISPSLPIDKTSCILPNSVEICQVDTADQVLKILSNASSEDLVIFDVDEVLIALKDRYLRPMAMDVSDSIFYKTFYPITDPEKLKLYGEWISQVQVELVSEKLVTGISELQNRDCRVMALTRMIPGAGACGKIPLMEDFRFNELKVRGIDFRQHFGEKKIELDLPIKNNRIPLFKDGILYALPYTKGEVLKSFLDKVKLHPRKIWFVDNSRKSIDSVTKCATDRGIPYTGIQYLDRKFSEAKYDQEFGEFQYQYFIEKKIWLNDQQARCVKLGKNIG